MFTWIFLCFYLNTWSLFQHFRYTLYTYIYIYIYIYVCVCVCVCVCVRARARARSRVCMYVCTYIIIIIIIIIIINITDWTFWSVPSPELQLLTPKFRLPIALLPCDVWIYIYVCVCVCIYIYVITSKPKVSSSLNTIKKYWKQITEG